MQAKGMGIMCACSRRGSVICAVASRLIWAARQPFLVLLLAIIPVLPGHAATELPREQLIANYILRITKNIVWPRDSGRATFRIALIAPESRQLAVALTDFARTFRVDGLPVVILECARIEHIPPADVVYLPHNMANSMRDLSYRLEGRPVLIISEDYENRRLVMVNLLTREKRKISFEVNPANILNQGLKVGKQLLLLGGSELDVARLYKESQNNLMSMESRFTILAREMKEKQASADAGLGRPELRVPVLATVSCPISCCTERAEMAT